MTWPHFDVLIEIKIGILLFIFNHKSFLTGLAGHSSLITFSSKITTEKSIIKRNYRNQDLHLPKIQMAPMRIPILQYNPRILRTGKVQKCRDSNKSLGNYMRTKIRARKNKRSLNKLTVNDWRSRYGHPWIYFISWLFNDLN